MAGVFQVILITWALGGIWNVLAFTFAWAGQGLRFNSEWASLAAVAFLVWPLMRLEEFLVSVKNRERNRIARLRRRV